MHIFSPTTKAKSAEVNENFTDLSQGVGDVDNNRLQLFRAETCFDFVQSGLVWSVVSGLNGSMTAGVAYIADGSNYMQRVVVAQIATRAFTASKDTYVDVGADGTVYYSEVANNATAPSLSANRIRIALIITNGSTITAVFQTEQRQANTTLTDLGWSGLDNLGNPVRNTNPHQLEFRITRHNGTGTRSNIVAGGIAQIPNMSFNYRTGRNREKIVFEIGAMRLLSVTGSHQLFVYVDGNPLYPHIYQDMTGGQWFTGQIAVNPYYQNANTTIAVTLRGAQTQTVNYTNATNDGSYLMPTVILKVTKAGA